MWQIRLIDKAAHQTVVEALDAFERGDPRLLAPLVERCIAQIRSEPGGSRKLWGSSNDSHVEMLEKAIADREMWQIADIVTACIAMPDFGSGLEGRPEDPPNLVEFGDHDARLYPAVHEATPGFDRWWSDRCQETERYGYGLSMFLLSRESLERLQEALRQVVPEPDAWGDALAKVRDRFLDLIARSLADERTTLAVSDIG